MSMYTILLAGEFSVTQRALRQIKGTRVIAADAGMRHAAALDVTPELWVGDFDSTQEAPVAHLSGIEKRRFPAAKNETDGELAIAEARARGATGLILVGAFGGPRADHAFLHLTLAMRLSETGLPVLLTSGAQEGVPLLTGEMNFDYDPGTIFSIIAFDDLHGLTLRGARWPLSDFHLPFGSSRTISNEVSDGLTVTLERGRAMLIGHTYPGPGF